MFGKFIDNKLRKRQGNIAKNSELRSNQEFIELNNKHSEWIDKLSQEERKYIADICFTVHKELERTLEMPINYHIIYSVLSSTIFGWDSLHEQHGKKQNNN